MFVLCCFLREVREILIRVGKVIVDTVTNPAQWHT